VGGLRGPSEALRDGRAGRPTPLLPARIIGAEKQVVYGNPEEPRVCTSHVERQNLHMRM
jgi:hypothetical protein